MDVEHFIKARLAKLESVTSSGMMHINGVDITQTVRRDVEATRKVMEALNKLEVLAADSDEGPWQLEYINEMWCAIANRWRDHKDFKPAWRVD